MPPRPSRNSNIRNVESGDIEARPRDAALRKSANERASAFIRQVEMEREENQVNAYPTVSQDFDQYASERTIQPTNNTARTQARGANAQYRYGASANQTRRVQTQVATPSSRKGARTAGRPSLKRAIPNVPVLDVNPVKLARATTLSITNITWGMGLWLSFQLPLAVISIILFGLTYVVHDVVLGGIKDTVGDTLYKIGEFVFSSINGAIEYILGVNLVALTDPSSYFMLTHILVFIIGFSTLVIMGIIYQISLINCVFGKHSALKIGTLIFATFAYMIPLLNIVPWFLFWVLVVWRYPE